MGLKQKYFSGWLPASPWEWIFFSCLAVWCFWPYRMTPIVTLDAIAFSAADLTIAGCALLLSPLWLSRGAKDRTCRRCYVLCCAVFGWAATSVLWADVRASDLQYTVYPVIMAFSAATAAYLYSTLLGDDAALWHDMAKRLCLFLTIVFAVYAGESVFAWGLRSEAGFTISADFGTHRLRGPLGGASTIHIAILPVLGFCLGTMVTGRMRGLLWAAAALALVVSIFLTGSRAALAGLFVLLSLVIVHRASLRRIAITAGTVGLAVWMLSGRVTYGRFYSFEDAPRTKSYLTTLEMATGSIDSILFGLGYGSIWPWYKKEMDYEKHGKISYFDNVLQTNFGRILYHPHSLFLGILVELGAFALLVLASALFKPVFLLARVKKTGDVQLLFFLFGLISTLPTFLFDYYLFKNWKLSAVWWCMYFIAIRAISSRAEAGGEARGPGEERAAGTARGEVP